MNAIIRILAVPSIAFGMAAPLPAAVTVSVDMNPGAPGIQSSRTVVAGQIITVELVMTVGAEGVSSYGVSVNFNHGELTLDGAPAATELQPLPAGFNFTPGVNSESQASGQVRTFDAATFTSGPANTSFVIGRINFTVPAPVTSATADVTPWFFNAGVDGCFDNAGLAVPPVFVSGSVDAAAGYLAWAADTANIPAGQDATFAGDGNKDGILNGVAYVFGTTRLSPTGKGTVLAPPTIPVDVDVYLDRSPTLAAATWAPVASWVNAALPLLASGVSILSGEVRDTTTAPTVFYRYRVVKR